MQAENPGGDARKGRNPFEPPHVSSPPPKTLALRKKFEDLDATPPAAAQAPAAAPAQALLLRGRRLGDILVAMGKLTPAQAQVCIDGARVFKEPLGQHLVRRKLLTSQELCRALSLQSNLPVVDFPSANVPVAAKYRHLRETLTRLEAVPFMETDLEVHVATRHRPSPQRLAEVEKTFNKKARLFLAPDNQITAILNSLSAASPAQKRRHTRYRITMPIWLQLCDERQQAVGQKYGGHVLNLSLSGLKVQAPDLLVMHIKELRSSGQRLLVRFSTPPLEVFGTCTVCYMKRKEKAQPWENGWILGLALETLAATEQEHFKALLERAETTSHRLELETGEGTAV